MGFERGILSVLSREGHDTSSLFKRSFQLQGAWSMGGEREKGQEDILGEDSNNAELAEWQTARHCDDKCCLKWTDLTWDSGGRNKFESRPTERMRLGEWLGRECGSNQSYKAARSCAWEIGLMAPRAERGKPGKGALVEKSKILVLNSHYFKITLIRFFIRVIHVRCRNFKTYGKL